jgi:hypothetical protein
VIDDRLPDDWTSEQNALYHAVLAFASCEQAAFSHPAAAAMPPEHWATLCHNFAMYAAVASVGDNLIVTTEDGAVLATSETGPLQ